jgi:hypothetical protein
MARRAKPILKESLAAWLGELDACFGKGGRLLHPLAEEQIGTLVRLIQADYLSTAANSPLEILRLECSVWPPPLERSEFPPDFRRDIVAKWDLSWKRLRVLERIRKYLDGLQGFWETFCQSSGGSLSPYTSHWVHHGGLSSGKRRFPASSRRSGTLNTPQSFVNSCP